MTQLSGGENQVLATIKKAGQAGLSARGLRMAEGPLAIQIVSRLVQAGLITRQGDILRIVEGKTDRKDALPRVAVGGVNTAKHPKIAKLDPNKKYTLRQLRELGVISHPSEVDQLMKQGLLDERGDYYVVHRSFQAVNDRRDSTDKAPVRQLRRVGLGRGPIQVGEKVRWGAVGGTWEVKKLEAGPQGGTALIERLDSRFDGVLDPAFAYRADVGQGIGLPVPKHQFKKGQELKAGDVVFVVKEVNRETLTVVRKDKPGLPKVISIEKALSLS